MYIVCVYKLLNVAIVHCEHSNEIPVFKIGCM